MATRTILVCATCGKKIKAVDRAAHDGHTVTERRETLLSLRGLSKRCGHRPKEWGKCEHPWYAAYKGHRFVLGEFASKPKAEEKFATWKDAIDQGQPCPCKKCQKAGPAVDAPITVEQLGPTYFEKHRNKKTGEPLSKNERNRWGLAMRTEIDRPNGARVQFGAIPLKSVRPADIEALKDALFVERTVTVTDAKGRTYTTRRGGLIGAHRTLQRLRAFFGWSKRRHYLDENPFRPGGDPIEDLFTKEAERDRLILPDEEERLFKAANPHLQSLMIAALATSCRVGELLSLQWHRVRFDLNEIHLEPKKTKARRSRHLPMTQRLRALLDMRKTAAENKKAYRPDAYVFGDDETGEQITSIRTAWQNCRLKAFGFKVTRDDNGKLTPESRAHLKAINIRFHDWRRTAGSRFMSGGMSPHYVQRFLDHANLSTTSRYLKIDQQGMHNALKAFEKARGEHTQADTQSATAETTSGMNDAQKLLQ